MMDLEVQKSAGCSDLISNYKDLINSAKCVDITTLREIIKITSDMITARECSRSPIPSQKELDQLFIFIPNVLDRDSELDTSTDLFGENTCSDESKVEDQSDVQDKFMDDLKLEIDSLGLDKRKSNTSKVVTQWILPDPSVSPNLKNAQKLEKFSSISKLCNIVNNLEETAGTMIGALVNYYPSGGARTNPHSDDESYVDQSSSIATFSLGSERVFNIFNKDHGHKQLLRSYVLTEKSLMMMQPGSQAVTRHLVASSSSHSGPRWSISFRKIIPSTITNEWPHSNNSKPKAANHNDTQDHTTLILGTSISRGLIGHKLAGKSGQKVINLSKGGAKIYHLSEILDQFFNGKHEYLEKNTTPTITSVKRVFVSVGTNDIRYAKDGVNHLYSPMQNLLEKIKLYYPNATVYVQSLLPQRVDNKHTVSNVLSFNKLLIKVCTVTQTMFLDILKNFLLPNMCRNTNLYCQDGVHLNYIGLGALARAYIQIIRGRFNPIIRS